MSWYTHSMSKECQECGMPFEDNVWEQSTLCDDCRELEELNEYEDDYLDTWDEYDD